jgi:GTP cyclohydrolase FolE2
MFGFTTDPCSFKIAIGQSAQGNDNGSIKFETRREVRAMTHSQKSQTGSFEEKTPI